MSEERGGEAEKWLTAKQVAKRYGLTVNWCYHCAGLQRIGKRFGKYIRYRLEDVIAFENAREAAIDSGKRTGSKGYNLQQLAKDERKRLMEKLNFGIM